MDPIKVSSAIHSTYHSLGDYFFFESLDYSTTRPCKRPLDVQEDLKPFCTAMIGHLLIYLMIICSTLLQTLPVMLSLYEHWTLCNGGELGSWRTLYKPPPPPPLGQGFAPPVTHMHIIQSTASELRDVGLLLPLRRA